MQEDPEYRFFSAGDHPLADTVSPDGSPPALFSPDEAAAEAGRRYAPRLPLSLAGRPEWRDPDGPLGRQVLPSGEELRTVAGFHVNPLAEEQFQPLRGLMQKYHGRVLLRVSDRCAVHCRYCFRRHDRDADGPRRLSDWQPVLAHIRHDASLREVIYSGGDPLMVGDRRLGALTARLAEIGHLTRLRIHSRMPVLTPERVTEALLRWLTGSRLTPVMVVHVNHAAELDRAALAALGRLADAGVPLLNQTVLLRGVNDREDVLAELCEALVDARVMPYYLHLLDPVAGAAHFQVSGERGARLVAALRARLPGYAVPRLVREEPGAASKSPCG